MDPDLISRRGISEKKRPRAVDAVPHAKKLRSNIPRRKRVPSFPMVGVTLRSYFRSEDEAAESSSSCFDNEISNSSTVKFNGHDRNSPKSSSGARVTKSISSFHTDSSSDHHFQPITKFYTKRKKDPRLKDFMVGMKEFMVPFSESAADLTNQSEPAESDGTAIAISGVSEISATIPRDSPIKTGKNSSESKLKAPDILSESSCLLPPAATSEINNSIIQDTSTAEVTQIQFKTETIKRAEESHDYDDLESDLACPEKLLHDDDGSSDYSACNDTTLSDFESDLFDGIYDGVSSDVSLSDLIESPEDFSERSRDNYCPSVAFSLLHQLYEQFNPSTNHSGINPKFEAVDELSEQLIFRRFPDIDDEESYEMFRSRERSEVALHDYSYGYHATTKYGDLIVGQRLEMVNWMMEHCEGREDHDETIFMGVNLMDRFLSRGYFQTRRNLQLLGIACVTLAARIEENQPFNNARKKSFKVGKNSYKRCDVVSMEWLVLEVLSFQCSLPTTHSFLWFYMKAARAGPDVQDLCRHLAILTLFNHGILRFWPSTIAAESSSSLLLSPTTPLSAMWL
ncbi:Cyclin-SDS-like [Platanthera guangdongensis]|uniref:Cyclin-SDS-like n=1 Tax=Platanthera guangdongensis TaxID=2320717 RepID=A0ABR2LJP4_9ASPA